MSSEAAKLLRAVASYHSCVWAARRRPSGVSSERRAALRWYWLERAAADAAEARHRARWLIAQGL